MALRCGMVFGSIPAYAGEAELGRVDGGRVGVDPRVCGGGGMLYLRAGGVRGRSPRMRGRQCFVGISAKYCRSIPAYAGEAVAPPIASRSSRVDPRVCGGGENW